MRSPTATSKSAQASIPSPPPEPPRPNPHSPRGALAAHLSRVHSLEAFGHRHRRVPHPSTRAGIRNPSHFRTFVLHCCAWIKLVARSHKRTSAARICHPHVDRGVMFLVEV